MARRLFIKHQLEDDRGVRHKPRTDGRRDEDGVPAFTFRIRGNSFKLEDRREEMTPASQSLAAHRLVLHSQRVSQQVEKFGAAFELLLIVSLCIASMAQSHSLAGWLVFFGIGGVSVAAVVLGFRRVRLDLERARAAVGELPPVCVSCGYELSGVPEADDGCTVCPECGAAWRLPMFSEG